MHWKAYNELAWTESILANPDSYEDEAAAYIKALEGHVFTQSPTLLHLGCAEPGGTTFISNNTFQLRELT